MSSFSGLHKPFIALVLLLVVSLACGSPPTPVPEPTMDVAQAIAGTETAASILTQANILITVPTHTNTIEPTFTTILTSTTVSTLTTIPSLTSLPLPTNTLVVIVPTSAPAAGVCSCGGDTYNCTDFSSHASAQACYNYCVSIGRGDIHSLDSDGDGDACESL